jgi:hypothetical protein
MEFGANPATGGKAGRHNGFGFKPIKATTNGVFGVKKLQINIVQNGRIFYYSPTRLGPAGRDFSDSIYGKTF